MQISGTIFDNHGTLVGASIILLRDGVKTNMAISTNDSGQFLVDNDDILEDDDFQIRFLGFPTQVVKARDLQDAKINLEEDVVINEDELGNKPKTSSNLLSKKKNSNKFYKTPLFVTSVLGLATLGVVIYVIKKSK